MLLPPLLLWLKLGIKISLYSSSHQTLTCSRGGDSSGRRHDKTMGMLIWGWLGGSMEYFKLQRRPQYSRLTCLLWIARYSGGPISPNLARLHDPELLSWKGKGRWANQWASQGCCEGNRPLYSRTMFPDQSSFWMESHNSVQPQSDSDISFLYHLISAQPSTPLPSVYTR